MIFTLALFLTLETPSAMTMSPSFIPDKIDTLPKNITAIKHFEDDHLVAFKLSND